MLYLNILCLSLILLTSTGMAQRVSILDDPNFLDGIDQVENPHELGSPVCATCEVTRTRGEPSLEPFVRERVTGETFPINNSINGLENVSSRRYILDSSDSGQNGGVVVNILRGNIRTRELGFLSVDGSRDGSYMYFVDYISAQDSHNPKTQVLMLPRRGIPTVRRVGSELHLTISTGEHVVLDATTKAYIRGPLRFGTIGRQPSPTPFTYTGSAIVLSASNNYKMPFEQGGAAQVNVRQNGQSCSIPRTSLWNAAGNPIAATDQAMVTAINNNCVPRPARPFTLP